VTAFMRPFARLIVLTLVVSALIVAPVSSKAHAVMLGSATTAVAVQNHAGISCDQAGGQKKPAGVTHHPDCCIAGTCAMSAGIPAATPAPAGQLTAWVIAYVARALAEPLGIEAIPTTHPPKAAA